MKYVTIQNIIFAATMILLVSLAYGLDYSYLTDHEVTVFGERQRFWSGDTFWGTVRSNDTIAIMGSPVFYGLVISSAPDFIGGSGYNPLFLTGPPPIFNAPPFPFPQNIIHVRRLAEARGRVITPPAHHYCVLRFSGNVATMYTSVLGVPFDSTDQQTISLTAQPTFLFFDCPVRVKGLITGQVIVATEYDINIDGDIRYSDADSLTGITPPGSTNYLALASMQDIKISNTVENGRENSNGLGRSQTNRNFTSVVVTAALYALGGGLNFENQNDPDSGYDYGSTDERGTLYIYGGVVQQRRGYVHRSNRGGSGYLRKMRWDPRLHSWYDGILYEEPPSVPDTVDLGNVPIGITVRDTVSVVEGVYGVLGAVSVSSPFHCQRIEPFIGSSFRIPVSITPSQITDYQGILSVSTEYNFYQIVVRARGIPPHSPELSSDDIGSDLPAKTTLSASPNPFNLSTELRYSLTEAGPVKLIIYDIMGREVRRFELSNESTGEHLLRLTADGMASGVYFAQLVTQSKMVAHKLLLMK